MPKSGPGHFEFLQPPMITMCYLASSPGPKVVTKTRDGTEPAWDVPSRPALLKPGTEGRNSELDCMLNHGTHLKLAAQYEYMYAHVASLPLGFVYTYQPATSNLYTEPVRLLYTVVSQRSATVYWGSIYKLIPVLLDATRCFPVIKLPCKC